MPACPWSFLPPAPAEFCEASLCAWIREPANTWSNVGFLVGAGIVYWMSTKPKWRHLRIVGHISLLTGLGSAFFHASETIVGEGGDYVGMYLGAAFMLCCCFRRWTGASRRAGQFLFWGYFTATMIVFFIDHTQARLIYAVSGIVCSLSDTTLLVRDHKVMTLRWLILTWILFGSAFVAWSLDLDGTWCNPDNHVFNGHALWHLLNAGALVAAVRYYEQFQILRSAEAIHPVPRP